MSAAPICPRCGSSASVVRGVPGLQPLSWSCRRCRFTIEHLSRAVAYWRLLETGVERPIRVTRRAA
jgi:ribosomal protein L37AE/L43A